MYVTNTAALDTPLSIHGVIKCQKKTCILRLFKVIIILLGKGRKRQPIHEIVLIHGVVFMPYGPEEQITLTYCDCQ